MPMSFLELSFSLLFGPNMDFSKSSLIHYCFILPCSLKIMKNNSILDCFILSCFLKIMKNSSKLKLPTMMQCCNKVHFNTFIAI